VRGERRRLLESGGGKRGEGGREKVHWRTVLVLRAASVLCLSA